jgi:hypothetical protein
MLPHYAAFVNMYTEHKDERRCFETHVRKVLQAAIMSSCFS